MLAADRRQNWQTLKAHRQTETGVRPRKDPRPQHAGCEKVTTNMIRQASRFGLLLGKAGSPARHKRKHNPEASSERGLRRYGAHRQRLATPNRPAKAAAAQLGGSENTSYAQPLPSLPLSLLMTWAYSCGNSFCSRCSSSPRCCVVLLMLSRAKNLAEDLAPARDLAADHASLAKGLAAGRAAVAVDLAADLASLAVDIAADLAAVARGLAVEQLLIPWSPLAPASSLEPLDVGHRELAERPPEDVPSAVAHELSVAVDKASGRVCGLALQSGILLGDQHRLQGK
jgi:hypothetical protein